MADRPIVIRPYRDAYGAATLTLFQRAIREIASRDYDAAQIAAWSQVDSVGGWSRRRASRAAWVAEIDGVMAGFTDLEPDGHLDMMYVSPDFQGVGVGSRLLETVVAVARRHGLKRIFTEASLTARPFFERRGFAVLLEQQVEARGVSMTNFRMEKLI